MTSSWVVRLLQDNKEETPILINVLRKEGGDELDLDLLATDGTAAFTTKVRRRNLKKLRAKNYDGSDDEWSNTILSVLGLKTASTAGSPQEADLDVTCSFSGKGSKRTLSLVFSNKVEDITQRLGTVELPQNTDAEDDVDLFGWTSQAIEQRDRLQGEVTGLRGQVKTKDDMVASLQKQIDELVEAKAEHEKQMLSKFALLLNEKKLKIRNMQRILSTAKIDQKKLRELQAVIGDEPAGIVRRKKRAAEEEVQHESDDTDAYETMDADPLRTAQQENESPESGNSTPTASEADDDTDDQDLSKPPAYSNQPRTRAATSTTSQKEIRTPPPKKSQKEGEPAPPTDDDDEATASEDDEL
ncbi:hypothetical protein A1O7_04796 [Cladophialophora yegresii CBS 114405]|uniref:XRCC4 coiled-coil domain-containing protein n=1 Tax=Cladophialophora yegresii CBS 114405 TaxID=1182544 RepID=W9VY85_9EURO|nr:uncharacterized protein A1O7_04796 [Cladophialophora yegresii CBS 114405]EXJ60643.1 hypothetical protein A1O7_04796 [Cladophialophora yegresii CBS 114405]